MELCVGINLRTRRLSVGGSTVISTILDQHFGQTTTSVSHSLTAVPFSSSDLPKCDNQRDNQRDNQPKNIRSRTHYVGQVAIQNMLHTVLDVTLNIT